MRKQDLRCSTQGMKLARFSRFRGTNSAISIKRYTGESFPSSSDTVPKSRVEQRKYRNLNTFVDTVLERVPGLEVDLYQITSKTDIFFSWNEEMVGILQTKYPDPIVETVQRA